VIERYPDTEDEEVFQDAVDNDFDFDRRDYAVVLLDAHDINAILDDPSADTVWTNAPTSTRRLNDRFEENCVVVKEVIY